MAGRLINTLIVFRILKMLTTPWEKTDAFKLGLIDKNGNRNKAKRIETTKEKDAMSMLHKLVFNLKRLVQKVPLGKSQLYHTLSHLHFSRKVHNSQKNKQTNYVKTSING